MMKQYEVKFEIYGKKMKTTVLATSEEFARKRIKDKIKFHSVKEKEDTLDEFFNGAFKDIFK